ncbi:arginine repressor [Vagococcus hydrophili]|uniref:Arginine repressor n=1 Tax=Vagococcus hydrophili TaxID=2714947 RepID=A0A6G8ARB7_9ENTE|nr:ArgR family transcriptional regulator [Vagococcus hydrophili]QIL47537.1 ArgR family transcriptional regulator [Vagococcus hydrophili]
MRKQERHQWIEKIITEEKVSKQEELVRLLLENNILVTQATVSRDIKEMKLVKKQGEDKHFTYSMPEEDRSSFAKFERMLKSSFMDIHQMDKMIVIITKPGSGFALGGAIESYYKADIFTVMVNDDKVLIFAKSEELALDLETRILEIV